MTLAVSSASAGTVGFVVVVLLGLATYGLLRSMSTRIGNVRRNSQTWAGNEPPDAPDPGPAEGPAGPAA